MNIFYSLSEVPALKQAVVTIGSFDGVHFAHKKLIRRINQIADEIQGDAVVVTFHPHPRSIVFPNDKSLSLLSTIEEKIDLFRKCGVRNLIIIPFTIEFAHLSAHEYVEKFLIQTLKAKYLVVGYDHKFGLARRGDFALLQMYEKDGAFNLIEIEKQAIDEMAISSTNIRQAILHADLTKANELLGGYYYIKGKVIKGDSIGRTIGYPTANIEVNTKDKLIPPHGIYACFIYVGGEQYKGMLYIGNRPTINEDGKRVIEVNIFDFNDNIYEEMVAIEIVQFTRGDIKFDGLESLKNKLDEDRKETKAILDALTNKQHNTFDATIAILNFNGKNYLESYLESHWSSSRLYTYQLAVIDNASTDDSIQYLKHNHPKVEVIPLQKNYGFSDGYNKGLNQINSKYLVIINSDVKVTEGWLDNIIQMMESDNTIGAVQPKILSLNEPQKFEYAGASGGFMDALAYPYCRGRIFDTTENDEGQYNDVIETFWVSGAAMVIRNDVFKNAGGFDGDFFAHQEEIDLCWRIKRAGYKCMVNPASVVYHVGGGTLHYNSPQKTYLNFRNNLTMLLKNELFPKVIFIFLIRLILDGVAAIKFLLSGQWIHVMSILRAHLATYAALPYTVHKRNTHNSFVKKCRIGPANFYGKKPVSILYKYFVQNKKTYSSLQ